jgi:hypothetical protein
LATCRNLSAAQPSLSLVTITLQGRINAEIQPGQAITAAQLTCPWAGLGCMQIFGNHKSNYFVTGVIKVKTGVDSFVETLLEQVTIY